MRDLELLREIFPSALSFFVQARPHSVPRVSRLVLLAESGLTDESWGVPGVRALLTGSSSTLL